MNEEIRRRTEPLRIFPSREGAMRMLTALWEDIHESWITGRVYLNMETLKEWKEKKETPDQTRDEEMVL